MQSVSGLDVQIFYFQFLDIFRRAETLQLYTIHEPSQHKIFHGQHKYDSRSLSSFIRGQVNPYRIIRSTTRKHACDWGNPLVYLDHFDKNLFLKLFLKSINKQIRFSNTCSNFICFCRLKSCDLKYIILFLIGVN